jgi:hypothetical protein
VFGVVLLAGAAFLAMRLLNRGLGGATGPGSLLALGGDRVSRSISIEKAEQAPERQADLIGELIEKEDNQLTVQQFVGMDGPGSSSGPTLEVVVTGETQVYRDATLDTVAVPPDTNEPLQQVLEPTPADEIETGAMLMVWGEKRGDRLIADVIIHMQGKVIRGSPPQ